MECEVFKLTFSAQITLGPRRRPLSLGERGRVAGVAELMRLGSDSHLLGGLFTFPGDGGGEEGALDLKSGQPEVQF